MIGANDDDDDDGSLGGLMDFGSGVTGRFYGWAPDRTIESNRVRYAGIADIEKAVMSFNHSPPDDAGKRCGGFVTFDSPEARTVFPNYAFWVVQSWDPMTLTPSLLCRSCGRHGFIRQGRWVNC